jgi:hypothetical protein
MRESTKTQLLALIGILIVLTFVLIYYKVYVENFITVNISQIAFQAPSTMIITVSGTMPENITGSTLTLKSFSLTSSSVDGDTTAATGNIVISAISAAPLSIVNTDSATITTNTVPTNLAARNNVIINGTGIVLIKNI